MFSPDGGLFRNNTSFRQGVQMYRLTPTIYPEVHSSTSLRQTFPLEVFKRTARSLPQGRSVLFAAQADVGYIDLFPEALLILTAPPTIPMLAAHCRNNIAFPPRRITPFRRQGLVRRRVDRNVPNGCRLRLLECGGARAATAVFMHD
jgi:hypothetical protein